MPTKTTARARPRGPRILPEKARCSHCHTLKPVSAFSPNRARSTGLQQYCKLCRRELRLAQRAFPGLGAGESQAARHWCVRKLVEAHPEEYEALQREARRIVLTEGTEGLE